MFFSAASLSNHLSISLAASPSGETICLKSSAVPPAYFKASLVLLYKKGILGSGPTRPPFNPVSYTHLTLPTKA